MNGVSDEVFAAEVEQAKKEYKSKKAIQNLYGQVTRASDVIPPSMAGIIKDKSDLSTIHEVLSDPHFSQFAKEAYDSELGYSIRLNPLTGEKEMFIAGTRHGSQWALNAYDTLAVNVADPLLTEGANLIFDKGLKKGAALFDVPDFLVPKIHVPNFHVFERLDVPRKRKVHLLEKIAMENDINVVYGHSRGGSLAEDMQVPGITKIGLDAAMVMSHRHEMINYNEWGTGQMSSVFDGMLGIGGKQNVALDTNYDKFHFVY